MKSRMRHDSDGSVDESKECAQLAMGTVNPLYRPEIDGLRAICVLGVMAFHAGLGLSGGYVGVDVFFVISGFLITKIIADELGSGRFSLARFWERRIRRIYPALLLVQIFTLTLGVCLYLPQELKSLANANLYLSFSIPNFYYWRSIGYFTGFPMLKPMLHTWSLGVEEQFYVIFPLLMMALARMSRNRLARLFILLAGVSFLVNLWWSRSVDIEAAFYLLPARAWELLAGSMLALANPLEKISSGRREGLSALGLATILGSMATFGEHLRFPDYWALIPVSGAWLFIAANAGGLTSNARPLAHDWPVAIGKMSYSLYLWHWPLIAFPDVFLEDYRVARGVFVAMTFPIAYVAWKYVEGPIRRREVFASRRAMFTMFAVSNSVMIAIASFVTATDGMRFRLAAVPAPVRTLVDNDSKAMTDVVASSQAGHLIANATLLGDASQSAPDFVVWGDSHAIMTAGTWDNAARQHGVNGLLVGKLAMNIVPRSGAADQAQTVAMVENMTRDIARLKIRHLILICAWSEYLTYPEGPRDFARFLDGIAAACPDTQVHVIDDVPFLNYWPQIRATYRMFCAGVFPSFYPFERTSRAQYEARNQPMTEGFGLTRSHNLKRHPVAPNLVDDSGHFPFRDDLHYFYTDNNHLTRFGIEAFYGQAFAEILRTVSATATPPRP